jgi:hypothetical protein
LFCDSRRDDLRVSWRSVLVRFDCQSSFAWPVGFLLGSQYLTDRKNLGVEFWASVVLVVVVVLA